MTLIDVFTIAPGERAVAVGEVVASSTAEFVAWHPSGGELADLGPINELIATHPNADVIYPDEWSGHGRHRVHVRRPDFSPERLRNQFFFGRPVFYRRDFLAGIGGISSVHRGAEDYELALRASRTARSIVHAPVALYNPGVTGIAPLDDGAQESTRRALQEHLDLTGGGRVVAVGADGVHDTRRPVVGEPLVSIVIPTRGIFDTQAEDATSHLLTAIRSILELSTYTNVEFVIVMDDVAEQSILDEVARLLGERLRLVMWRKPFNFSEKINLGVIRARGEYVLILNDDVQILTPDWIESLLALAQRPGAGMSGAMLYYEDNSIQHAGHAYYEGDASHIGLDTPRGASGPLSGYRVEREVSGVTAACAMMPISVFHEAGGMSNLLPGNFNDVDLCMKVTGLGYEIYWTPHAELYHFESKTRDASVHGFEAHLLYSRWGFRMNDHRYWPYAHSRKPTPSGETPW
ncbi:glycosyltransferase [Salinibacterium sp.]|uniref:glycosyltransferase family 2 protein n=1 Tax=Salinibacterium sp. TaxID=1915057 RepID=UPI00286B2851|nr:glycosyltransferase [Salinibacterium sp.]